MGAAFRDGRGNPHTKRERVGFELADANAGWWQGFAHRWKMGFVGAAGPKVLTKSSIGRQSEGRVNSGVVVTAGCDGKGKAPPKRKAWTEPAPSCDGHQVRPAYCFAVNNISSLSTRAAKSWSSSCCRAIVFF